MADRGGDVGVARGIAAIAVGADALAHPGRVDQEVVAAAAERRFQEARRKAGAEIGRLEIAETLDLGAVDPRREEDGGFEPQSLSTAEQVAVLPIGLHRRAVDRRIASGEAEQMLGSFVDLDEDRQVAGLVQPLGFADADRADGRDRRDRLARVGQRLGRIGFARLQIDEGANHLGRDVAGLGDRDVAEAGHRAGIDEERDVHGLGGVVDDGADLDDARERAGLVAPVIDQRDLRRPDRGRKRGRAGHEARDLAGVGDHRRRIAASARHDVDVAQRELRPRIDGDHDRGGSAVAVALGCRRQSGRRLAGLRHRDAVHRDRDLRIEIALGPERIDQWIDVGGGAAGQSLTVGRGIFAQAIEQRGVLHAALQGAGIGHIAELELQFIGQRGRADRRRLVLAAEEVEDVERRQVEGTGRRNLTGKHRRESNQASAGNADPAPSP